MSSGLSVSLPLSYSTQPGGGTGPYRMIQGAMTMIQQNLKTLLLTCPGERVMDERYGVGLRNFLFEPNTPVNLELIRQRIRDQVKMYMPFVIISNLQVDNTSVDPGIDENTVFVSIAYSVPNIGRNILRLSA